MAYAKVMSIADKTLWKLRRIQSMSLPEIAYRLKQTAQGRLERAGFGLAQAGTPTGTPGHPWRSPTACLFDVAPYIAAADAILRGRFDVFALGAVPLGFPPQWNRDCRTGTVAPLVFGKTLNYRDENIVGDIKYLWEPNRHLEFVTLAQAFHLTGERRYADGVRGLLESWFDQCPYPLGPNWTSSLEPAVRLVNWSFAWYLLGGDTSPLFEGATGPSFRRRWLEVIFQHCHFIAGHFSLYSSANNHLLGEYMGLLFGSMTWALWPESQEWQKLAHQSFEAEALKQTFEDGVNREQAIWYHHEVADMMLLCGLAGRANGITFGAQFWRRLEAMLEFIASLIDVGGNMPRIGDADDAVMVRFSREPDFDVYRSLLATGSVLFRRGDFKAICQRFDDKSRWLLGDTAEADFSALQARTPKPPRRHFPQGGYYVLGRDLGQPREIRIVADCGPLGYLSIAAHGHADALAFVLSVAGEELLVDPGTYAYHTQKVWRDYFRSTRSHNTVCVDGLDQSVIGGNFMWVKHANAALETWDTSSSSDRLVGSHDGYLRLPDPVLHRREILFDKVAGSIRVRDSLQCKTSHQVELHWHCHEHAEVSLHGTRARVARKRTFMDVSTLDDRFALRLARGEDSPPLGWISRRLDCKVPTTVVTFTGRIEGSCTIETLLQVSALG